MSLSGTVWTGGLFVVMPLIQLYYQSWLHYIITLPLVGSASLGYWRQPRTASILPKWFAAKSEGLVDREKSNEWMLEQTGAEWDFLVTIKAWKLELFWTSDMQARTTGYNTRTFEVRQCTTGEIILSLKCPRCTHNMHTIVSISNLGVRQLGTCRTYC